MKLKMSPVNLEWDCIWNWEEDGSCSGGLVAVCGWTALREEDLHGGNQNHRNSISRSGVMTPLLGRASGEGLRDWLPTLDSHHFSSQHTQTASHTCAYTSSGGIWRGLITSWDLRLTGRPGPRWFSSIQPTWSQLCICLCVQLSFFFFFPLKLWLLFNLWV